MHNHCITYQIPCFPQSLLSTEQQKNVITHVGSYVANQAEETTLWGVRATFAERKHFTPIITMKLQSFKLIWKSANSFCSMLFPIKTLINKTLTGNETYLIRGISCSVQHVLGNPRLAVSSVHVTL